VHKAAKKLMPQVRSVVCTMAISLCFVLDSNMNLLSVTVQCMYHSVVIEQCTNNRHHATATGYRNAITYIKENWQQHAK
jgi:hypothetical protein